MKRDHPSDLPGGCSRCSPQRFRCLGLCGIPVVSQGSLAKIKTIQWKNQPRLQIRFVVRQIMHLMEFFFKSEEFMFKDRRPTPHKAVLAAEL